MNGSNSSQVPSLSVDNGDIFDAPNMTGTPERNLLMAVLERAILDFVGNDETEIGAAEDWLFKDHKESGAFSFRWICEHLDLDYEAIAKTITEMPKRGNQRVAPWYFQKRMPMCA